MSGARDLPEADELEALLARAERDPAASRELDFLADLVAASELVEQRARTPVTTLPGPLGRPWLLAAAATLLFALACGFWWLRREAQPTPRVAWSAPPLFVATELRGPEVLAAELARAMEPYGRGAWDEARLALEAFLAQHPGHGPARFYLAVVLGELGELERAREHYGELVARDEPLLAEHARFRRALLDLVHGREAQARSELCALVEGDGPFAEPARQVLAGEP